MNILSIKQQLFIFLHFQKVIDVKCITKEKDDGALYE